MGRLFLRGWTRQDKRSAAIGALGVLLIHLLLWLVSPHLFTAMPAVARPEAPARQFSIELTPESLEQPETKAPAPSRFVETNPDAPENIPDKTENFGAHNQQVAQEKPTPDGRSDRPATEGQKEIQTTQIVSGQLTQPIEHIEAVPPAPETPPSDPVVAPRAEQNPLAGFEKIEGENKEAYGSNVTRIPENTRPIPERIEGARDVPLVDGATGLQPAIDPKRPRPRPQMAQLPRVRPAFLADNPVGTANIGPVAYDAKWSNYGAYLQAMIEIVQIQWERLLLDGKIYPPSGTTVTVKFVLNSAGNIARIVQVDNRSTDRAERVCISAITDRAPYGPWTDDMIAVLGKEQELTFSFHYQ